MPTCMAISVESRGECAEGQFLHDVNINSIHLTGASMSTVAELQRVPSKDLAARITALESALEEMRERVPDNKVSIILLSGDFDKAMAAFMMATGAVAMGMEVTMFFTFW